jgi:hypothetical protein
VLVLWNKQFPLKGIAFESVKIILPIGNKDTPASGAAALCPIGAIELYALIEKEYAAAL